MKEDILRPRIQTHYNKNIIINYFQKNTTPNNKQELSEYYENKVHQKV